MQQGAYGTQTCDSFVTKFSILKLFTTTLLACANVYYQQMTSAFQSFGGKNVTEEHRQNVY